MRRLAERAQAFILREEARGDAITGWPVSLPGLVKNRMRQALSRLAAS